MKVQLDPMSNAAGWTATDAAVISPASSVAAVDWPFLRASFIPGQLQVLLNPGATLAKTFAAPIPTPCDTVGFTVATARFLKGGVLYVRLINGTSSTTWQVPLTWHYRHHAFFNPYPQLTGIEFIADGGNNVPMQLMLTDLLAYTDDLPEDLYVAVRDMIRANLKPNMPIVGYATVLPGATTVLFSSLAYTERFTVLDFGGELHQVKSRTNVGAQFGVNFTELFDGPSIKANYVGPVKLAVPVLDNPKDFEGVDPGIAIEQGFDPQPILDQSFNDEDLVCTDVAGNIVTRRLKGRKSFQPLVYGTFRSSETEGIIRAIFGQIDSIAQPVWINGARHLAIFGAVVVQKLEEDDTGTLRIPCHINVGENAWLTTPYQRIQTQQVGVQPALPPLVVPVP